ncbi:ricin-type beta-trefoil lectin domain protein [Embleya sp. AB8]|uniref:ricin-type beta-trefoil lectin domain protein n=1 Tax=Embleya sp. AB8 TaxID=3156304 RepID=UPI003C79136C
MSGPNEPNAPGPPAGSSSAPSLAQAYARRPARPRRGLVPGRRVWVSLASAAGIAAVTTLAVAVTPSGTGGGTATGSLPVAAAGVPGAASTGTPGTAGSPALPGSPTAAAATSAGSTPSAVAPATPAGAAPEAPAPEQPAAGPPAMKPAPPRTASRPPAEPTPDQPRAAVPPPRPNVSGSPLRNPASGKCLSGSAGSDGTPLVLWSCNGDVNQKWDIASDGTIRDKGLCMDAAWGGTATGTVVQLAYCSGNPAQQFTLRGNTIYAKAADKCVDIWNNNSGDGADIRLWPCHGHWNQAWTRS